MKRRTVRSGERSLRLLSIPPPYRSWIAISNDPDATTMREWEELHALIWEDVGLPIADSFFLVNHSERIPDQVCVESAPEILQAHEHDTMHTWGDFCDSTTHGFTREDAVRGLELLARSGASPRVWVDHANCRGNLIHNAVFEQAPGLSDASGHEFPNPVYSLDLIEKAGVRYVWDGGLTGVLGQDRPIGRAEWYGSRRDSPGRARLWSAADVLGRRLWRAVDARKFSYVPDGNRQYAPRRFPDGRRFYEFRRHGTWRLADIDGLAQLIGGRILDDLCRVEGTMVLYTHLGKRRAQRKPSGPHVTPEAETALRELSSRHRNGDVMVSSTSRLLDYLVVRDHAVVQGDRIELRPDGIRFAELASEDLIGLEIGVLADRPFEITCQGKPLVTARENLGKGVWRVRVGG